MRTRGQRKEQMKKKLSSKDIAVREGVTQRSVNYQKNRPDFPEIEWVGRTWRVEADAYEAWAVLQKGIRGKSNE